MGENIGRKEIKKKGRKKERKKVKSTKQKEKREMEGGEEDRMKNRKEKERKKSWDVGTDPVHWYINRHSSNFCYHWSWWLSG